MLLIIKTNITLSFLLYFVVRSQAQAITCIISDSARPLQFVTVTVIKDLAVYREAISDSAGRCYIPGLSAGAYVIRFSFVGYDQLSLPLVLRKDTIIYVRLTTDPGHLKEFMVKAHKPWVERKIDRLVFNVGSGINLQAQDVLELLSRTPEVRVQGNAVSVVGKGTAAVMVDGKLLQLSSDALAAYLKSITAESVASIEVMTNPPAGYSAEGGGLINIILKKKKELGYSGTATLNETFPPSQTIAPGVSLNYNKKNTRYYLTLNGSDGAHYPTNSSTVYYPVQTQSSSTSEKELSQYYNGLAGFDADLKGRASLGMSFNLFNSYPYQTNTIRTSFTGNSDKRVDSTTLQRNRDNVFYQSRLLNVHYVKAFDTLGRRRMVLDADWSSNGFNYPNDIQASIYGSDGKEIPNRQSSTSSVNTQSTSIYSLNAVVYLPNGKHELSFGGKVNFIVNRNNVSLQTFNADPGIPDINTSNSFVFNENTQAAFVNYKRDLGKRITFQAGLRSEYTQTKGDSHSAVDSINRNSYFELFPTGYLLWRLNDHNTLTLNYGRRINRPDFIGFNPYLRYWSQYEYQKGNPFLRPSFFNGVELSGSFSDRLHVSVQYTSSRNSVGRIGIVENNSDVIVLTPFNYLTTRTFVLGADYSLDGIKWLQSANGVEVSYNRSISSSQYTQPVIDGWGAELESSNSFFINEARTVIGGLYFFYRLPEVSGFSRTKALYFFDVSAKYLLMKSRLQFVLRLSDVFRTKNFAYGTVVNNIATSSSANSDSRRLILSVSYSFGNSGLKKGQAHSENSDNSRAN